MYRSNSSAKCSRVRTLTPMMGFRMPWLFVVALACAAVGAAQTNVRTHAVNADGSLTFEIPAPHAQHVFLEIDTIAKPLAMTMDGKGVWSVTTPPLPPEIYDYQFIIDNVHFPDPINDHVHAGFGELASQITVPGQAGTPWENSNAPHGVVADYQFTTHVAKNLPGNQSHYAVYTPPGYDAHKKGGYPVLYLLHGYTDDFDGWVTVGRANLVLDNMIAQGKCVPMIVVMPLGYGDWNFLTRGGSQWNDAAAVYSNAALFDQSVETEVMPAVDADYNVAKGRENHGVAGLSMGGLETIELGLTHPDQFAYVAAFSAAMQNEAFDTHFPDPNGAAAKFKLLWVSVGVSDHLLQPNRDFVAWAKAKGYTVDAVETPGSHQWPVWRENLVAVLPMLFR
jgi:enterochelin esterase-like enzyme